MATTTNTVNKHAIVVSQDYSVHSGIIEFQGVTFTILWEDGESVLYDFPIRVTIVEYPQ